MFQFQPIVANVINQEQVQLEKMQIAMGILDASAPPDMYFVKHVTLVVKITEARVPGGTAWICWCSQRTTTTTWKSIWSVSLSFKEKESCFLYHASTLLERWCLYLLFLIWNCALMVMSTDFTLWVGEDEGGALEERIHDFIVHPICLDTSCQEGQDWIHVVLHFEWEGANCLHHEWLIQDTCGEHSNAGFAVKLQINKIKLTSVNVVVCIKALASICRCGKLKFCNSMFWIGWVVVWVVLQSGF